MSDKIFGTDGVRDIANAGYMTPSFALSLGQAYGIFLREKIKDEKNKKSRPKVLIGTDTRRSCAMIKNALSSGLMSAGAIVCDIGVFPTAGVSYLLSTSHFDGGAVVSASHNPAEHNGIKLLSALGGKLSDEDERTIENLINEDTLLQYLPTGHDVGYQEDFDEAGELYAKWLFEGNENFADELNIAFDCANGAATDTLKRLLEMSDIKNKNDKKSKKNKIYVIGDKPDGANINLNSGVMHLESISAAVRELNCDIGIAFDGDSDRALFCDAHGRIIDGDIMLLVLSRWLKGHARIKSMVMTVMSNMALEEKIKAMGIEVHRCDVGDKNVFATMTDTGAALGGEQSGHIIIEDALQTGDGIRTALVFIKACRELGEDIDTLLDRFERYPQSLKNIRVADKNDRKIITDILSHEDISAASQAAKLKLGNRGRILIRPSGTEPLIRILVEADEQELLDDVMNGLHCAIENLIDKK